MRAHWIAYSLGLFILGCDHAPPPPVQTPTTGSKRINPGQVRLGKLEAPPGCTMLGTVQATYVFTYDAAIDQVREKAAEMGADWVTLDTPVAGRAFWCPPAVIDAFDAARNQMPIAPTAAPAPYSMLCEPDCSPGFTCLRGQCVEACNPKCTAPQRCGADRSCH